MGVGDSEAYLGEGGHAVCISEFANADEAVGEAGDNVAGSCVR